MNMNNFNEAIKPIFDRLNLEVFDFKYNEEKKCLISQDYFMNPNDLDDPMEYIIIIRLKDGAIISGCTDGLEFFEDQILGYMSCKNGKWLLESMR